MDSGKRRVLFVIGSLELGGAESQLVMLAEQLSKRSWFVDVFALKKAGPLVDRLSQAGIQVTDGGYPRTPVTTLGGLIALPLCQLGLFLHIRRSRPDVVHAFLPLTNFMGALAGRAASIPLVLTSKRALGTHQDRYPGFKWFDRVSNALSHRITANSNAVAQDTCRRDGCDIAKLAVIPNGLDFDRVSKEDGERWEIRSKLNLLEADVAIAMVANLIPYKGHSELIEAFATNAAVDARLKLFLIGEDRGIAAQLNDQAARLGILDRMFFLGRRSDVPALLSAMDIGVMSSHEEGFSNALLEKLATGLPVVATNVGGNPEALDGMPDCVLVEPRDSKGLAEGISHVIARLAAGNESRAIRQRLVRERYSVRAMVSAHERLYAGASSKMNKAISAAALDNRKDHSEA